MADFVLCRGRKGAALTRRLQRRLAALGLCDGIDGSYLPPLRLPGPDVLGVHFTGDPLPGVAQSSAAGNSSQMGSFRNSGTLGTFAIFTRKLYALYRFLVHVRATCKTCQNQLPILTPQCDPF